MKTCIGVPINPIFLGKGVGKPEVKTVERKIKEVVDISTYRHPTIDTPFEVCLDELPEATPIGLIYVCWNYDMFIDQDNRRKRKNKGLKNNMSEGWRNEPITVKKVIIDGKVFYKMIDGGHRFKEAKELGLPIVFKLELKDITIAGYNSDRIDWTAEDYLEYYKAQGNREYWQLGKFVEDSGIQLGICREMYGNLDYEVFKSGNFKVVSRYRMRADQTLDIVASCRSNNLPFFINETRGKKVRWRLIKAIVAVMNAGIPGFNHLKLKSQLLKYGDDLLKDLGTTKAYIDNLETVYNYMARGDHVPFYLAKTKKKKKFLSQ
jgi:hypothetical protein